MLQPPKRMKFRKAFKGRNRGVVVNPRVCFGSFGMQSIGRSRLNARQIEAARRTITRCVKRGGKIWIRVFPDKPISKKPLEVRQGKGKGAVEFWAAKVRPGKLLFEIDGVSKNLAMSAFELASAKLPIKTKFVSRLGS